MRISGTKVKERLMFSDAKCLPLDEAVLKHYDGNRKKRGEMTELEKLEAGLEYSFADPEVDRRKQRAMENCWRLNQIEPHNKEAIKEEVQNLFGYAGQNAWVGPGFHCDNGLDISVGTDFVANYNVTILDIAPVTIGDYCMIGPNTLITTVGHPVDGKRRRNKMAFAKPVVIGDDVWIGGNCTILPGVHIGNNVVVTAGAVVTKDVPDNCIVGGVPAKVIKELDPNTGAEMEMAEEAVNREDRSR